MKIFLGLVFLLGLIYNIDKGRKNTYRARLSVPSLMALMALCLAGFLIWFYKDALFLGFLLFFLPWPFSFHLSPARAWLKTACIYSWDLAFLSIALIIKN